MRETFCNPVPFSDGERHTNPDPFILRWCGRYYCYATDEAGVKVSVSEDMVHWEYKGYAIAEKEYHHYWAPSVIYLNGLFYMYYSNTPAKEPDCHEEHLKLAVSENPLGPFTYRKTFFEKFSIDSHPVMRNGELYMFYSVNDWIGLEPKMAGTCILLDKMVSPGEFEGKPQAVVLPSLPQEIYAGNRFGDGRDWYTIEGASPVFHGDKCWMLYSANAFENIYYFVGTAVADVKENLREMAWKKYPNDYTWIPLLRKNQVVEGTGHNTVTKSPGLFEDWIVYHGRDIEEGLHQGTEQRNMRIDPLLYFGGRMFCPGPSYQERPAPGRGFYTGGGIEADETVFLTKAPDFYRMEIWCSAECSHAGARYMIYPYYEDERHYVGLEMHSGMRKIRAILCRGGIAEEIAGMDLPEGYDFGVPHLIGVEKKKDRFQVTLDEDESTAFRTGGFEDGSVGKIGAGGCFTALTLHSVTVSEGTELRGEELFLLPAFYDCSGGEIRDGVLKSLQDELCLKERRGGEEGSAEGAESAEDAGSAQDGEDCGDTGSVRGSENAGNIGSIRDSKDDGSAGSIRDGESIESSVMESFEWQVQREGHRADLYQGDEKLCSLAGTKDTLTFYIYRGMNGIYILTDGNIAEEGTAKVTEVSGMPEAPGVSILSAAYGKEGGFCLRTGGLSLREYGRNVAVHDPEAARDGAKTFNNAQKVGVKGRI